MPTGPSSLQQATDALAAKLKQNPVRRRRLAAVWPQPGDAEPWDQAEDAYRHAIDLGQTDPETSATMPRSW